MSGAWENLISVCGVMLAAELLARLCPKNDMVGFVKGLVILALLCSSVSALFSADWDFSLPQNQAEDHSQELSSYVSDQLETAAQEDLSSYFRGLLASAGLEAEKILLETDIAEDGCIVLKKAGFLFAYDSDARRAAALLRNVLDSGTELEVQTDGT